MKRIKLCFAGLFTLVAVSAFVRCTSETASGPTPYSVFGGQATSSSSVPTGKGIKIFTIPAGMIVNSGGRVAVISNVGNDSIYMKGAITGYDRGSGNLTVDVTESSGSGIYNNWNVVLGKTVTELLDSVKQAYVNLQFGMFFHFNMSTFDRCCCERCVSVSGEWGLANTPEKEFRPSRLDCGQWADAAKSAGCKYMVLVTKHHDGFCLWPSKLTKHSVANATCTTDVVRQFVDSARSRGMRVSFYYSMRDLTNGYSLSFIEGQLTELLTNYGDILCLWFDGWGWDVGYRGVPYDTIRNLIKRLQPNCLVIENNHEFTNAHSDLLEWEMPIDGAPPLNNIRPAEGNEPIRYSSASPERCWFWHPLGNCDLMPAQMIVDHLKSNNTGHAAYLLDVTPDTLGLVPQCQADMLKTVGTLLGVGTANSYTGR